ncbi:RNA pseudouridylate synthase domain-containing protein 1 [Mactra antiquata]
MRQTKAIIQRLISGTRILFNPSKQITMTSVNSVRKKAHEMNHQPPKIVHLSANFLCVDKGYDIKINFDDPTERTLEHQLKEMFPELVDPAVAHSFRYVHRLDYATSGILCLALNKRASSLLAEEFSKRRVTKYYLALVRGHLEDDMLYIDVPTGDLIDNDWPGRRCILTHPCCKHPKQTQTLIVKLETGYFDKEPVTKILLKPITGKQHQLRVHCDHIGHRVVGDFTYSLREDVKPDRMMLHSYRLTANTILEKLDLYTTDPFTSDVLPDWRPVTVCYTYKEAEDLASSFIPYETKKVKHVTLDCDKG